MNDLRERVARAIEARVLRDGFATHEEIADAAIAAGVGAVPGWRPIGTAPRDETDVLLFGRPSFGSRSRPPVVAGWYENGVVPGWYTYDEIDDGIDMTPTH